MIEFGIKFQDVPTIQCRLDDTSVAQRYYELLKTQYQQDPCPLFRDQQEYTFEYFRQLADRAHKELGWNWRKDNYDLSVTTLLHKDLEQYLAQGYENIPAEHDTLLHELHFALHALESGNCRESWLQIEWFNNNGFPITEHEYPAKRCLDFGDIRLQNPYVGHHPLYLYEQRDFINISQTCRFHNFVKPGINLVIMPHTELFDSLNRSEYISWFQTHDPEFVAKHGEEQIWNFTGHPVVGHVVNRDDLKTLIEMPVIKFESLIFGESK